METTKMAELKYECLTMAQMQLTGQNPTTEQIIELATKYWEFISN